MRALVNFIRTFCGGTVLRPAHDMNARFGPVNQASRGCAFAVNVFSLDNSIKAGMPLLRSSCEQTNGGARECAQV